jgi:dienelactone hydrolase
MIRRRTYSVSSAALWGGVLLVLLTGGCASDDYLRDIDTQTLFATPTPTELGAVRSDWDARDLSVQGYREEKSVRLSDQRTELRIVSFLVRGQREYGILVIPQSTTPLPVRLFVTGFERNTTEFRVTLSRSTTPNPSEAFIYAVPTLRGQSLLVSENGQEYRTPKSEGEHGDAFDGATDDAIAFLNVIAATVAQADLAKVSARGGSRGGTVALLLAERDARIKGTIGVAFPTDLLSRTAESQRDPTYQLQFLQGIANTPESIRKARQRMIASSPLYFCEKLPRTQVHFGVKDQIVPLTEGVRLKTRLQQLGAGNRLEYFEYPDRGHSDIGTTNLELEQRVQAFLAQLF